jgi:oxygen-independent coproporphyrinogen-3 oxidase
MKPGIYIHIPFCEQKCHYCAFTVAVSPESAYEPYVRRLIREIELENALPIALADTIFLGGGTPSLLDPRLIESILSVLPKASEITLEANPGTLGGDRLARYRKSRVNRISLGAQSFHDDDLCNAGRLHSTRTVLDDFESLRAAGFTNINIDLIAGLPGQKFEMWRRNMDYIERLRPEHVSIYMLEIEERSAWGKHAADVSADDDLVTFYRYAADRLEHAGYVHYEISNWSLPGFECRHNLKYWTGEPYRGFGVSAHSFSDRRRYWNTSSLKEYAERIDSGSMPVAGEEYLNHDVLIEESFLLGLRQTAGFNIWTVAEALDFRYPAEWFQRVAVFQENHLVSFDGQVLKLTPDGWLLANGITQDLLWPTLLSTSEATR